MNYYSSSQDVWKDSSIMNTSIPSGEALRRIGIFQGLLEKGGIDGALIVHKVDLIYLTGMDQDAHLWVPASGEPLLMVRKSMERALQDAALEQIVPLTSFSNIPEYIQSYNRGEPATLGLELDILPHNLFRVYERTFPEKRLTDISSLIRRVRMIKSDYELSLIRRAAGIADTLCQRIPEFLTESETEIDVAIKAEGFYRAQGHPSLVRTRTFNMEATYGHIMAGSSAALPSASPGPTGGPGLGPWSSQGSGWHKIGPKEPIIIDFTACVEGYLSDQARIFSLGRLPKKLIRAHQVMLEVQDALARNGRPGTRAGDLYAQALRIVEKAGLSEGFMGHSQPVPFVGHGLGLELDEWPVIGKNSEHILERNMVMALEPKIVFPGEGVIGIENTFVVTDNGLEKLNCYPDEITMVPLSE